MADQLSEADRRYRDRIAEAYLLYTRYGVPASLWFQVDNLNFRRNETETHGWSWRDRFSGVASWQDHDLSWTGKDEVFSFNNLFYKWTTPWGKKHRYDDAYSQWAYNFARSHAIGSSFLKIEDTSTVPVQLASINANTYQGKLGIKNVWGSSPVLPPAVNKSQTSILTLNQMGTTAISRVIPTNPSSNLATFLGELREGLPSAMLLSVYKERTRNLLSNAGGEYLNYVFGWKPMVDDLRSFATQIVDRKATLDQYHRDAGQKVRREYHYPASRSTTIYDGVRFQTGSVVSGYAFVDGRVEHTVETEYWFSGAFRYYLPEGNSTQAKWERYAAEADRLLGVDLTPEVLWNLAPWSWMLDWFGDIGSVMTNISNLGADGTVMQYGYLMERKNIHQIWTSSFAGQPLRTEVSYLTKRRMPASPYGFGVTFADLSAKQLAILAALGLSHRP